MNSLFKKWLELGRSINQKQKVACPTCGKLAIQFQYVGDPVTKIGYLDIWCGECLRGIHVSRVQIPGDTPMLDISTTSNEVASHIPNYKQVVPED